MKSDQKIALVTGSNRGIGLATVKRFLQAGMTVILTSRKEQEGAVAVDKLSDFKDVHYHPLDITSAESVAAIKDYVSSEFQRLDVLINNAGINYDTHQNVENADLNFVTSTIDTNLMGAWRMCQAFVPLMKRNDYGRIVNVSSGAGELGSISGGTPAYSISKAALNALTIGFGNHLKNTGILVNAVGPGWVRTDMGGMTATRSPEKGAETIVWAAQFPKDGPTAKFFRDKQEVQW